jgi:hypothetical protein
VPADWPLSGHSRTPGGLTDLTVPAKRVHSVASPSLAALLLCLLGAPASAQPNSLECAAALTEDFGRPTQAVRDLKPTVLPILAYGAEPGEGDFKHLATIGGVPIRLFAYRVNAEVVHISIFEPGMDGGDVLADTAMQGAITELTYRPLGGTEMVTVHCYW